VDCAFPLILSYVVVAAGMLCCLYLATTLAIVSNYPTVSLPPILWFCWVRHLLW